MRTTVKGKNIAVSDRVRQYAEKRFARLDRVLDDRADAVVELSVEHHHSGEDSHIVEATLVIDGQVLRGHAAGVTHQAGIDTVVDRIERRAVDFRSKPRGKARRDAEAASHEVEAAPEADDEPERRIVKVKRFDLEPVFAEDAIARMEELGHAFYVFVDAETERIAIVYRRGDGDYGVIEPVVGGGYTPDRR
ncbi:MAG: ribosome hibernation-promoting factor, HPF/YfiA family [Chloroflexota bacterium]